MSSRPPLPRTEAAIAGWLQDHLPALASRMELGILCAGQGVRLDLLGPPQLPLPDLVPLLCDHLGQHGGLRPFAEALLSDDIAGPRSRERGLPELLRDGEQERAPRPPLFFHQGHQGHRPFKTATFVGRTLELGTLDWAWQEGARVLGLTGPAGSGKSALLRHWLDGRGLSDPRRWTDFGVEGLFFWSFAVEPDVPSFLRAAADYVEGHPPGGPGRTIGPRPPADGESHRKDLQRLLRALDRTTGHVLLVLDGLERFQAGHFPAEDVVPPGAAQTPQQQLAMGLSRPASRERPGDIIDPSLRSLLIDLAAVDGEAALLCTLEREVPSLITWQGSGYVAVPVTPLPVGDGSKLLKLCGVSRGSESDIAQRCVEHRGHALTLEILGRFLQAYYQGDARAVSVWELPPNDGAARVPEAPTLYRVFKAQVQALTESQRGLLDLCVLLPGPIGVPALLALAQVATAHLPQGSALAVEAVLAPLRGLSASELRAHLIELGNLGLLQLQEPPPPPPAPAPAAAEDTLVIDLHPLLRRHLYRGWLDARGGRALGGMLESSEVLPRPQDAAVLDLMEQLVLVALEAGLLAEAYELLVTRMGGYTHLCRNLGEYRRLLGVLRILSPVLATVAQGDSVWSRRCARVLSWEAETLRDLGKLDEALAVVRRPAATPGKAPDEALLAIPGASATEVEVHLLAGRLRQAAEVSTRWMQEAQEVSSRVLSAIYQARGRLLSGDVSLSQVYLTEAELDLREQPGAACEWNGLGLREVLDRQRIQLALRLSDYKTARGLVQRCQTAALRDGRGKDLAHLDILLGETARRERDPLDSAQAVHRALGWGSRTGDAEVLVSAGLCHARIRLDSGNLDGAASALGMALPTAVELGFGLDRIDLLLSRGHLLLRRGDLAAAENDARDALAYATSPECGYLWGEADALHLLALVLLAARSPGLRVLEAVTHLTDEIELRERMLDPRAEDVRWLLRRLAG